MMGTGTGRKVFVKDSHRVESPWPCCPHNVTALYKNGPSHGPAPRRGSLGGSTREVPPEDIGGRGVTSALWVRVKGGGGGGVWRVQTRPGAPSSPRALSSGPSQILRAVRLCVRAGCPGIRPSVGCLHSSSPFYPWPAPDARHPEITRFI